MMIASLSLNTEICFDWKNWKKLQNLKKTHSLNGREVR